MLTLGCFASKWRRENDGTAGHWMVCCFLKALAGMHLPPALSSLPRSSWGLVCIRTHLFCAQRCLFSLCFGFAYWPTCAERPQYRFLAISAGQQFNNHKSQADLHRGEIKRRMRCANKRVILPFPGNAAVGVAQQVELGCLLLRFITLLALKCSAC